MIADCTALILAGGASTRMGCDKTVLTLEGQTLLQRVIGEMQRVFPTVLVSVQRLRNDIDVPQICDEIASAGPLAGVCAGLAQARTPWVFVIAADMPFIDPAMVATLAQWRGQADAVVPMIQGFPQPLAAFYAKEAHPVFQKVLAEAGKHSLRNVLDALEVCWVDESSLRVSDPGLRSFVDLDTPEDFSLIQRANPGRE